MVIKQKVRVTLVKPKRNF